MAINDEEDKLQRANLVRSYAPIVGVGTVGSTPITDQTNLNVAAAMERGDNFSRGFQPQQTVNALRASRDVPDMIGNAVTARQQALADGLQSGVNPDAPAITISPKTRLQMVSELHALSSVAHQNAITKAHTTAQIFKQQRDTEAANDYVNFIHDLNGITAPFGSTEHAAAASQVFEDHPLALQTTAGREAGMLHARVHDTSSKLRGKKAEATPEEMVYDEAVKRAAKLGFTPDEFLNAEVAAGSNAGGTWVGAENGKQIRIKAGGKTSVREADEFNSIKRGLQTKNTVQGNVAPLAPVLKYNKETGKLE